MVVIFFIQILQHSILWGIPFPDPDGGIPPFQVWTGSTLHPDLGRSIPIGKDGETPHQEGWEYPPIIQKGVPPEMLTDPCENSTFPHPLDAGGNNHVIVRYQSYCHWIYVQNFRTTGIDSSL